ncbi:GPW/gp25 family protein [Mesorhizobium sp. CN2-181]|uniref:GPW/gp25 family protein n=1 Tax=Mesorhizobium yinganensis TaxID=3157707 RepID=UPI0032B76C10
MSFSAIRFPFGISARGAVSGASRTDVIRQQIEQVLFTNPGERVGRPTFGCGIERLVFAGTGSATIAAAEYTISVNLREAMGDLIDVDAVRVTAEDAELLIDILFTIRATGEELHMATTHPLEGAT